MTTDEAAEAFLDQDLSDLDFAQFKPVRFHFEREPFRIAPGSPAPRSGTYRQTGPRGGRPGGSVTVARGNPLPAAAKGRSWTLVDADE